MRTKIARIVKEDIGNTIDNVKEAAEKIEDATNAVSDAMEAVNNVTTISNDDEEIDAMDSVKTE